MRPSCLENVLQLGYTYGVVDSLEVSFKSTRPPGKCDPEIGLRARSSGGTDLEKHESSPRLAARDGMEQEPYEFRIRLAKPGSEGEATHGTLRKYAFLASQKTSFERGPALRIARGLLSTAGLREQSQRQEITWAKKKTWAACRKAATRTTRNRSRFSAGSKPCACVPPCSSAPTVRWAVTTPA